MSRSFSASAISVYIWLRVACDIVAALEDTASVPDVNVSDADTPHVVAAARTSTASDTDLAATVQRLAAELAALKQAMA